MAQEKPATVKAPTSAISEFLAEATERFNLAAEAESATRRAALDDLKFSVGQQWPQDIEAQRNLDGRPCLTMNHLPQFIRQVTNGYRQQRPQAVINPVGGGADQETAEIFQGAIRHIEVQSDAEVADDHAFDCMVRTGFGYTRVITEYCDDEGFDQEIKIKWVKNQFTVYFDPNSVEPDYSDALYCFVIEDMAIAAFKDTYGKSQTASLNDFASIGDQAPGWATKDTIRVAEYFYVETESKTKFRLDDGTMVEELPEGIQAVNKREFSKRTVKWSKFNAIETLEGGPDDEIIWPGKWIPVIPVLGEDVDVDGTRFLAGLVRNMKDPQRMYNYWCSSATEGVALAPKAPFIMAEGQDENHEKDWAMANVKNFSRLVYKPVAVGGTPLGPPQRNAVEPPIQAMVMMIRQADNDLKAGAGIYDASLGQRGPEQSGKALEQRKSQGELATLNYSDNAARALRHRGRILIDLIPKIYDTPRLQRIINPDGSAKQVGIYNSKASGDEQPQIQDNQGDPIKKVYDIGVGSYDVTVSVGPSYQTQRQEAAATQVELMKALPQQAPFFADIAVRNMDIPQSKELADRLKKMLPPQLQDEDGDDPQAQMQKLQQQLMQLTQQHDMLTQHLNSAVQEIQTKQVEQQGKVQIVQAQEMSKQMIVKMQEATKIAVAQINASKDANQSFAENEIRKYELLQDAAIAQHDAAHEVGMQAMQQSHQQDLQQQQAAQDQQSQQSDQAHQQEMSQQQQAEPANAGQ